MKELKRFLALVLVAAMIFSVISLEGTVAKASDTNGTLAGEISDVTLTNEGNNTYLSQDFTYSLSAGDTLQFTVEFSEASYMAIWFLIDGSWDKTDCLADAFYIEDSKTFYIAVTEDIESWTIGIQLRSSLSSVASGDLTGMVITLRDFAVIEDTVVLGQPTTATSSQKSWSYYATVPAGSTFSFDISCYNTVDTETGYFAVWVDGIYEDGTTTATQSGSSGILSVAQYSKSGSISFTTTEDYVGFRILVEWRNSSGARAQYADSTKSTATEETVLTECNVTMTNITLITPVVEDPEEEEEEDEDARTLTLNSGSAQDSKTRYLFYLDGFTTSEIKAADSTQAMIYVDGVETEGYFYRLSRKLALTVAYDMIESGATTAASLTQAHVITVKAGTTIGSVTLDKDFHVYVDGATVKGLENVTLSLNTSNVGGAQDGSSTNRYLLYFKGLSDDQIESLSTQYLDMEIDGTTVSDGGRFYKLSTSTYCLFVTYDTLGISSGSEAGTHLFKIPAGTVLTTSGDNYLYVQKDAYVYINNTTIQTTDNMTLTYDHAGAQDNLSRYLIYFDGASSSQVSTLNGKSVDLYVNGELVENAGTFWNLSGVLAMTVSYDTLVSGATSYSEINCNIELPEGLVYGNINVTQGIKLLLCQSSIYPSQVVKAQPDAVTVSVSGTVLTIGGTGTVTAADVSAVSAATITEIYVEGPSAIAGGTFSGYTALTYVYLANTVKEVASNAFVSCASGVSLRYVAGNDFTGGLTQVEEHPYYSYKMLTIGSSYGEDMNNYIYTLATTYFASLEGRTEEDIAYDEVVIAELFTGSGDLSWRIEAINGLTNSYTCYYEKWSSAGISIPTSSTGTLTARQMYYALQDEYWDYVVLMQSAENSRVSSSFLTSTAGDGIADIDAIIAFVQQYNKNGDNSQYYWLQTWSYNYKLNSSYYSASIGYEITMRKSITAAMQNVVQLRVKAGTLDGILNAGAAIEYLKVTYLNQEDLSYSPTYSNGTYNEGKYSTYFALQRDTAHASVGLGRFTLGLAAFSQLQQLSNMEILMLDMECFPASLSEYQISKKLSNEQSSTKAYLLWDEETANSQVLAYWAVVSALSDPFMEGDSVSTSSFVTTNPTEDSIVADANGDGIWDIRDIVTYKKVVAVKNKLSKSFKCELTGSGSITDEDVEMYRNILLLMGGSMTVLEKEGSGVSTDDLDDVVFSYSEEINGSIYLTQLNYSFSAGETVAFTLELSETHNMAVWFVLDDGTYLIADAFYDISTRTFYAAIPQDTSYVKIQVQFRTDSNVNTVDTEDHSGITVAIRDITVLEDTIGLGQPSLSSGQSRSKNYYVDLTAGSTISFDTEVYNACPTSDYYAIFVYELYEDGSYTNIYAKEFSEDASVTATVKNDCVGYFFIVGFRSASAVAYTSSVTDDYAAIQSCYAILSNVTAE